MTPLTDPRLRPLQHCCTRCGCRSHANGDFACSCLRDYRWESRLFWLYAAVVLTVCSITPIALFVMLVLGVTR